MQNNAELEEMHKMSKQNNILGGDGRHRLVLPSGGEVSGEVERVWRAAGGIEADAAPPPPPPCSAAGRAGGLGPLTLPALV